MNLLSGLGALAGGAANGLERGERLAGERQRREANQRAIDEQEKVRRDLEAADQAMASRLREFQAQAPAADPVAQFNRLGGTDESMPDQSAIDAAPAAQPWRPDTRQLLAAAQARTDKLFELGRHDAAVKQWAQDEGLRAQLRRRAAADGMTAFQASGDPKPLLDGLYSTIDDGYELADVQPSKALDPGAPPSWRVDRVNSRTGERKTNVLTAPDIQRLVEFTSNPEQAAKYALMEKLQGFGAAQKQAASDRSHEQRLMEIGARHEGELKVAGLAANSRIRAAEIGAEARQGSAQGRMRDDELAALRERRLAGQAALSDAAKRIKAFEEANPGDLSRPGREAKLKQYGELLQERNAAKQALAALDARYDAYDARKKDEREGRRSRTLGDAAPAPGAQLNPSRPTLGSLDPASRPPLAAFEKRN